MPKDIGDSNGRLVEYFFPLEQINVDAAIESGFKGLEKAKRQEYLSLFNVKPMVVGPRLRNLHTWFARRPCSTSRALTLGSIANSTFDHEDYIEALGKGKAISEFARKHNSALLFYAKPSRMIIDRIVKERGKSLPEITVLDPMAGGGSIPLESLRLGFRTIAVEYNPVAYLITKASTEFPAKYADSGLFEETLKASKEFILEVRKELGKFYSEEDTMRYIFARGVRCPFCSGLIPVQGVEPAITRLQRFKNRFLKVTYDKAKRSFSAETTDKPVLSGTIAKRGNNIKCPYDGCGKWFQLRGRSKSEVTAFDQWFHKHAQMMERLVEGFEPATSEIEEQMLTLHIPFIKQVGSSFHVIWEDDSERKKFTDSWRALGNELLELQNFIPLDEIPPENAWAGTARSKKLLKWYMLFNPRQLLSTSKMLEIVAKTTQQLVSKNGEFGAAVATYLAFSIDKAVDYNTIATMWNQPRGSIAHTFRGESSLDFRKEYCESNRMDLTLTWALEPDIAESAHFTKTAGGLLPVLRFLCDEFRHSSVGDRLSIYLGDAAQLSTVVGNRSVDVINVDPPYFEQVIYSDRSELFWALLRRSLQPALELLFKSNLRLNTWTWTSSTVPREHEIVAYDKEDSQERFHDLFKRFVDEDSKVLKDDGVITLWFTHPTAKAWRVVSDSLYNSGFVIPKVWPLQTEYKLRFKKQWNVAAQEMSLVIVGRKLPRQKLVEVSPQDVRGSVIENPLFTRIVEDTVEDTRRIATKSNASPADTAALMFGTALSVASRFQLPIGASFSDIYDAAITAVVSRYVKGLISKVLTETGPTKTDQITSEKINKNITQSMLLDAASRSYLTLWLLSRVDLATGRIRQETLGLHFDLVQTVGKLCGFGLENLKQYGLVSEKTIEKSGRAYYPQFLEMLTLPGGRALPDKIREVAPGMATILARSALTESGDPTVRAKTIRAKMGIESDRELASNAALSIILLETALDKDLGYRTADKTRISGYLPGMDESEIARVVRELAIKTLTQLVF